MDELEYISQMIQAHRDFCNHLNGAMIQMRIEQENNPRMSPQGQHYYRLKRLKRDMNLMVTKSNCQIDEYRKVYQKIKNNKDEVNKYHYPSQPHLDDY